MSKSRRTFTAEFKQDAVEHYYLYGKSIKYAADDLKVSQSALNSWIQSAKKNEGVVEHRGSGNYSSDADKEFTRLKITVKG